ncbi:unnamed protein product [Leptidea sinapis]|uniref:Ig-like domain-containing protein n=1 Tax=Leptidea sinapis TaxID=189913 RepID=A0A5E4QVA8_9NEOP|nr:unnamed protein product [Leptidea sinapis]
MVKYITCVLVATFIALCSSQPLDKLPVLEPVPSVAYFQVSKDAVPFTLRCSAPGRASGVKFHWQKNGKDLNIDNENIIQRGGDITILKPTENDAGQYKCLADSVAGVASSRTINVQKAFIDPTKSEVKTHKPIEGKPFKLDCKIPASNPKPKISWSYQLVADPSVSNELMNPRILASPDGDLYFSNITKEDVNIKFKYVCVAVSPVTHEKVVLAEHILDEAVPSSDQDNELTDQYISQDMTAKYGEVTMIYCIFGGTPLAHPDWFKDGVDVNGQPGDRITRYNRSKGRRLLIRETWFEDEGSFKCVGNNEVGKPREHILPLKHLKYPLQLHQLKLEKT